jgi:hypothetical protein
MAADNTVCDDNNSTTTLDVCVAGTCVGAISSQTINASTTRATLSLLHPAYSYAVTIRAATAIGYGPSCLPINVTTLDSGTKDT